MGKENESVLASEGFQKVPSWECMYVHKAMQLFLSVYVDDYKMAGEKEHLGPMWRRLGAKLDLEPPVSFGSSVYLGLNQREIPPPMDLVRHKAELLESILKPGDGDFPKDNPGLPEARGDSCNRDSHATNAGGKIQNK